MRKITRQSADAFANLLPFKQGNTNVTGCGATEIREWYLKLHNNLIAKQILFVNELWITDAGWQTVTTKERLNGVLDRLTFGWGLFQKKGEWYLTDGDVTVKWTGSATFRAGHLIKS
jgi:hypothetical protein